MSTVNLEAFRDWTHENYFTKGEVVEMFSNFNFSTTEQIAGTWIDGKPIYSKTLDYHLSPLSLPATQTWVSDSNYDASDIDTLVGIEVKESNVSYFDCVNAYVEKSNTPYRVNYMNMRNSALTLAYITLFYTKESDI